MCNSLTIEASEDSGVISFSSEWISASEANDDYETPDPSQDVAFPQKIGIDSGTATNEDALGWVFARAFLYAHASGDDPVLLATMRSFSININNNITPKAPKVKTEVTATGCQDTFVITGVREGQQEISGSFVIDYLDTTFQGYLTQDTELEMLVIAKHPQSNCFEVEDISQGTTTNYVATDWKLTDQDTIVELNEGVGAFAGNTSPDAAFGLYQGGAIMLEDTSGVFPDYVRDIALVKTAYEGNIDESLVLDDGLDYWTPVGVEFTAEGTPAAAEDYIVYDQVLGIHITGIRIDTAPLQGGPADVIGQEVNWTAGQKSTEAAAMTWITGDSANSIVAAS